MSHSSLPAGLGGLGAHTALFFRKVSHIPERCYPLPNRVTRPAPPSPPDEQGIHTAHRTANRHGTTTREKVGWGRGGEGRGGRTLVYSCALRRPYQQQVRYTEGSERLTRNRTGQGLQTPPPTTAPTHYPTPPRPHRLD